MHSFDVRKLACHIYSIFQSLRKTGMLVRASHSSVSRWLKNIEKKPYDSKNRLIKRSLVSEALRASVIVDPLLSLTQLRERVLEATGVTTSRELLRIVLKDSSITRKKAYFYGTSAMLPSRTTEFVALRNSMVQEGRVFYSIDEVGFGRNRYPVYGYAPKGHRILLRKKCTREPNVSVIACVSKEQIVCRRHSNKPITGSSFASFLSDLNIPNGAVILLDNASIHKSKEVVQAAASKGFFLLFTPPYSPWFNPIEGVFSVVKRHYYKHGDISRAFDIVSSAHCSAFFGHAEKIDKDLKSN